MFSSIKAYAIAFGTALFAGLIIAVKILTFQKQQLKEENAGHVKKDEIIDDMNLAEIKAKEKAKHDKNTINDSDWRDSI